MSLKLPPVGTEPLIHKIRQPSLPQFVFEWHREVGKVYAILLPGKFIDRQFVPDINGRAQAFVLAEHCDTHGRFYGFVQSYLRGYKQGMTDEALLSKGESNLVLGTPLGGPQVESAGIRKGAYDHA